MSVHQWLAEWSNWGWPSIANHLWQATLVSLIVFAATGLLKNGPGRARYALLLIASAKFVLPSVLAVQIPQALGLDFSSLLASRNGSTDGATVIFQLTAPIGQTDQPAGSGHFSQGHNELFCVLTALWLAGTVSLLAMWLTRRRRFRRALRSTVVTKPAREREALDRVRSWLGIKREVGLAILPGTVEPGVWGVWRPRVFLPQSMAGELSDSELEAVMMHEMIHVARWDNLIANLQRILCCVFWFHPFVWILDRRLLAERERACDDEVLRLGGAADVYASSLVKVLRFCLGWNIAGASNATGSSLGRRIERIMSTKVQVKLSVWHRVAIGSVAALVIVLSVAAGLLTRDGASAQTVKPRGGPGGGVPGGIPGGVPDEVPGGVPGGISGYVGSIEQDNLIERLAQAPEVAVEFRNSRSAPLQITEAKVRAVLREEGPGDEFAVVPVVTLSNSTDRRIRGVALQFRNSHGGRIYWEEGTALIEPHAVYTSGARRRLMILVGRPEGWSVRVSGVLFEDGEVWGVLPSSLPPPPPPPIPPSDWKMLEWAPETAARFTNRDGAPLSITGATLKAAKVERAQREGTDADTEERYMISLVVTLVNNTSRRITGLGIEYGSPDSDDSLRTYGSANIEPHGTYTFETPSAGAPGYGTFFVRGKPDRKEVSVIGAKFEDGDVWGSFPPPPPPPLPPPPPEVSNPGETMIRKSGGVMAASAIHRVVPESPPLARAARITGTVVVEVTLDQEGNVIRARAISGHPLLKDAAVNAAREWRFNPTLLSGVPVKVIGTLTFNFEP